MAPGSRRALTDDECRRVLAGTGWGVLSVVEQDAAPWAVPVGYAWDGERLFLATNPGRKLAALEANPHVCLTLVSVASFDDWQSLVVRGTVRWVDDNAGRMRAIRAFARQARPGREPGVRDAGRLLNARIAQVEITELAGRARG